MVPLSARCVKELNSLKEKIEWCLPVTGSRRTWTVDIQRV
jgi:hypothetical protein